MCRRSITFCVVAVLFLGGLVGVQSVRCAADSPPRSREKIINAQLKLIQEAQELCKARLRQPGVGFAISSTHPELLITWSRREVEVRSELGGAADRIRALEAHKDGMKSLASQLQQLHDTGRIDRMTVLDARYEMLQAELWLAEARTTD